MTDERFGARRALATFAFFLVLGGLIALVLARTHA